MSDFPPSQPVEGMLWPRGNSIFEYRDGEWVLVCWSSTPMPDPLTPAQEAREWQRIRDLEADRRLQRRLEKERKKRKMK